MTNIRMKIATAATVLGLGGLAGFAMASNPANDALAPASTQVASGTASSQPVVTGTSGATASTVTLATQPVSASKPVVTHTSGATTGHGHKHRSKDDDGPRLYED